MKKVMLALACVLAATVAAQPAYAQFITRAEREMMLQLWRDANSKQAQTVKEEANQEPKTAPVAKKQLPAIPSGKEYLPGKEMKIVYSAEYGGQLICDAAKCCWNGVKKLCKTLVKNNAKYGPGGPEMNKVNAGVFMYEQMKKKDTTKAQEAAQVRAVQDSITREVQKAALRQAQKAAQEENK